MEVASMQWFDLDKTVIEIGMTTQVRVERTR
jgi:hypothetical protein